MRINIEPGLYEISNEEYHSSIGYSRSDIMSFKQSPRHFWHKKINMNYVRPASTPAMLFGEALHTAILEPLEFDKRYAVADKIDRRTNLGKSAYIEMLKKNEGKVILSSEEKLIIDNMCESIFSDNQTKELITGAKYEKSIFWVDPETQILCKCRPDIWHDQFVVDYKTTNDASERAFQRSMYDYGYYLQMAMIQEGLKHALNIEMNDFIFLAQEKTEPYLPAIYQLDPSALEYGVQEFKEILWLIKTSLESNYFPGYQTKMISLPAWSN